MVIKTRARARTSDRELHPDPEQDVARLLTNLSCTGEEERVISSGEKTHTRARPQVIESFTSYPSKMLLNH